jgi:diguanylate cyclase (GGDEF)-like protein
MFGRPEPPESDETSSLRYAQRSIAANATPSKIESMNRTAAATVMILARDAASAERFRGHLERAGVRLIAAGEVATGSGEVDLILADHSILADVDARIGQRLASGEIGLITVGSAGTADVSLPADASGREIRLACQLLVQIVRMRRQQRSWARQQKVLSHLALTDALTGLPNRRAWQNTVSRRLAAVQAGAPGGPVCIGLIDLDHFKSINDQFGHGAGDRVLQATADALAPALSQGEMVARLGGDEFALLLPGCDGTSGAERLGRIRENLAEQLRGIAGGPITASCGLAATGTDGDDQGVLRRADQALRRAKQEGRDRLVLG